MINPQSSPRFNSLEEHQFLHRIEEKPQNTSPDLGVWESFEHLCAVTNLQIFPPNVIKWTRLIRHHLASLLPAAAAAWTCRNRWWVDENHLGLRLECNSTRLTCCSEGPNEALRRHRSHFNICHPGSDRSTCCMYHLPLIPCGIKLDSALWSGKTSRMTQGEMTISAFHEIKQRI